MKAAVKYIVAAIISASAPLLFIRQAKKLTEAKEQIHKLEIDSISTHNLIKDLKAQLKNKKDTIGKPVIVQVQPTVSVMPIPSASPPPSNIKRSNEGSYEELKGCYDGLSRLSAEVDTYQSQNNTPTGKTRIDTTYINQFRNRLVKYSRQLEIIKDNTDFTNDSAAKSLLDTIDLLYKQIDNKLYNLGSKR